MRDGVLLRPDRKGTWLSLGLAAVFGAIGAAMVAAGNYSGIGVLAIALVGLYAGIGGFLPGIGLRLDEQGFRVRSLGKSWSAEWLEVESLAPAKVQVGRKNGDVAVVQVTYVGGRREPRHKLGRLLGIDERYVIAAYGGLSNVDLAALMERYRSGEEPAPSPR